MTADVSGAARRNAPAWLDDTDALDALVAAWRAGTLPKPDWTHAAHVGVCAWHAFGGVPVEQVFARMRAGILAYNEAVGTANTATSGYHETLTRFWAGIVVDHLATAGAATRLEAVRSAVAAFGAARDLHVRHYAFDVVRDPVARATWVAPGTVTTQDN